MKTIFQSLVAYHGRMDGVLGPSGLPCCHKGLSRLLIIPGLTEEPCWAPGTYHVDTMNLVVYLGRLNGVCWASWAYRVATKSLIAYLACLHGLLGTYRVPSKSRTIYLYFNGHFRHIFVE